MRTDEELKKTFKTFIDENGIFNVVYLQMIKDPEENIRQTELIADFGFKIFEENPQKIFNFIIDISPLGTA